MAKVVSSLRRYLCFAIGKMDPKRNLHFHKYAAAPWLMAFALNLNARQRRGRGTHVFDISFSVQSVDRLMAAVGGVLSSFWNLDFALCHQLGSFWVLCAVIGGKWMIYGDFRVCKTSLISHEPGVYVCLTEKSFLERKCHMNDIRQKLVSHSTEL